MRSLKHREHDEVPVFSVCSVAEFSSSPEDTLLLNCAVTEVASEKIQEALKSQLDWEYIVGSAIHHRVAPLLYYNLEKTNNGLVPQRVVGMLHETYTEALANSIVASYGLKEVLKAFSDSQLRVIVLKGAALAETIYPDIALRPYCDIDLLILKEDQPRATIKLSQLGYDLLFDYRLGFSQRFGHQLCYVKGDVTVDLHWHITGLPYSKYIAVDRFWKRVVPVSINGIDTLALSPEQLLIHLCLHASKHSYCWLFLLTDISEVIRHYRDALDWRLILEESERYRIHFLMRSALRHVEQLFDSPIPAFVLERLDSYRPSSFEARVFDVLASPNITESRKATIAEFLALPGVISKARYLYGKLFPSRDFILKMHPKGNIFSAYCSRISNVISGAMRVLLQVCTKRSR